MRCLPRRGRQQWVIFLLLVCLLGVYLTYKQLQDSQPSATEIRPDGRVVEHLQQQLREKVNGNLKLPNKPILPDVHLDKNVKNPDDIQALPAVFPAGRALENDDDYITDDERLARLKLLLLTLSPTNWKTTLDPDEMILLAKSELLDLGIESKLTCKQIDSMKSSYGRHQGFYGKKIIDYVQKNFASDYVLKSVGRDQQLKIECMKMDYREDRCHLMGNYRLVKELVLFSILDHPSIIKLEGFCLRGETIDPRVRMKGAIIVTEAGKQMQNDLYQLLPWATKVELGIQLMKLLLYLDSSPIGSLGFDKLQINDFVMINSEVKLVDLDNLMIGESSCNQDEHCKIENMPRKEIKCVDKMCKGRNMWKNLFLLQQSVLSLLLKYSPQGEEASQLLESVQELRLTPKEVLNWFEKKRSGADKAQEADRQKKVQREIDRENKERQSNNINQNDNQGMDSQAGNKNTYIRQSNANFPGKFDYHCGKSRVSWGCVLTVTSLDEAKSLCDNDATCASFIIFSGHPESDAVMTMVMKNSADGNVDSNYGATLFKKNKKRTPEAIDKIDKDTNADKAAEQVDNPAKVDKVSPKACFAKVANSTKSARSRREKRLLTHLGLRGINEKDWMTYAASLTIAKYLGPSQLSSSTVEGGRFRFQFGKNGLDLKKGEFIAEKGPQYHHIAYLATYHLDRALGLYHIPPTVARTLTMSELKSIQGDRFPLKTYLNITGENGLQGVVTVPMPPVMKTNELTLEKRANLVVSVTAFTRNQKVQLEYILLWALTKMMQPQHGHLGYKGHLIHFEADLAFESLHKSLTGYFYHCQFPNTVYKTLVCYKCQDSKKSSTVCGLGHEIIRRIKNSDYTTSEIRLGTLTSKDLINVIDSSASAILQVVEQCIKTFSREKVLY